MRFGDLLSRVDDEALQLLMGPSVLQLLLSLDPGLATPGKLRKLVLDLHSAEGLLRAPEKQNILIDVLSPDQAQLLGKLLEVRSTNNVYESLKRMSFPLGSERERVLFDYFELTVPTPELQEVAPTAQTVSGQYALFKHQRVAAGRVSDLLSVPPRRAVLHMPTGSGKTRTAMNIVAMHIRNSEPTLVVWLAQTEELCEQTASEFETAWSALGNREVDVLRFWGGREIDPRRDWDGLLVAGLAKTYSATKKNIGFILELAAHTSLMVIDEAHSAIAETYKLILSSLVETRHPNAALLGLTATPGRTWADIDADEELANFFSRQKVTLEIEGYDSPVDYLVDQQYLAQAHFESLFYEGGTILSDEDVERVREHLDIPDSILKRLAEDEMRNAAIVASIEELAKRHQRILVFAATVEHSNLPLGL